MRGLIAILVGMAAGAAATAALAAVPAHPPAPPPPQSIWVQDSEGNARHLASGLACPLKLQGAVRSSIIVYRPTGLDVSCGYSFRGGVLTVYITRAGDLPGSFDEAKRALVHSTADRRPELKVDERRGDGGLAWMRAAYEQDGGRRSDIWLTGLYGWQLKYRITYFAREADGVGPLLAAMTDTAVRSAGAQLRLCSLSAEQPRDGKLVLGAEDQRKLATLAAVLGGAAAIKRRDENAPDPWSAVTFCAAETLSADGAPMAAWRGVTASGADAGVERLTLLSQDPPATLTIAHDAAIDAVRRQGGAAAGETWLVQRERSDGVDVFGVYEGRPPLTQTAALFMELLGGKLIPVGGFTLKDQELQILTPPQ